jgi:ketopantoate reductase
MAGAEKVGAHKTSMLQDYEAGRPMELEAWSVRWCNPTGAAHEGLGTLNRVERREGRER